MIITIRFFGSCCAAVLAISALTVRDGAAQSTTNNVPPAAIALERQAQALLSTPKKWAMVARSLERAAQIRGADDPQAVRDMFLAAAARVSIGQLAVAETAFIEAADWALANGDVEMAATGYTRAALAAYENKDLTSARQLRDKAVRLTHSPLLSVAQREAILGHFTQSAPSLAARN